MISVTVMQLQYAVSCYVSESFKERFRIYVKFIVDILKLSIYYWVFQKAEF